MTEDEIRRLGQLLDEKMSGVDRRFDELHRHFDVVAENLQGQIQQVAEGVVLGNERLDRVEVRLDGVDGRLDHFETAVRADFAQVEQRAERFETAVRAEFVQVGQRAERFETEVRAEFVQVGQRAERFETAVRADFAQVEQRAERFETAVRADFAQVEQRAERFETAVRADFSEVKSMVKLSFAELDRRLTTLESTVHDLTGRLERLETRTS